MQTEVIQMKEQGGPCCSRMYGTGLSRVGMKKQCIP